jgi:hypothetical protein
MVLYKIFLNMTKYRTIRQSGSVDGRNPTKSNIRVYSLSTNPFEDWSLNQSEGSGYILKGFVNRINIIFRIRLLKNDLTYV